LAGREEYGCKVKKDWRKRNLLLQYGRLPRRCNHARGAREPDWRVPVALTARQTFGILAKENADMLWAFLLSLVRDNAIAEELFDETFSLAWKKVDAYDTDKPFGAWIRGIARTLAMAKKRQLPSSKLYYFDQETIALLEVQFSKTTKPRGDKWEEKMNALKSCLDALPRAALDLISLRYHKNYSCREMSNRLNAAPDVVKKRLQRSRSLLLDCVSSRLRSSGAGGG